MAGLSSLGGFGEIIGEVGPLEKVVLLVLVGMSVISWAIILHKALQFRMVTSESARFLKTYRARKNLNRAAGGILLVTGGLLGIARRTA